MKSGQELNQEQRQESWRKTAYWLALPGLLNLFSYTPQNHLSRGGPSHSGLEPPPLIADQQNAAWTCLQVNLMEVVVV